jgi:leucyl-tRNA synthetase
VREDYESLKFNTAVSKLMVLTNSMTEAKSINKSDYLVLLQLLAPMATKATQEMYEKI